MSNFFGFYNIILWVSNIWIRFEEVKYLFEKFSIISWTNLDIRLFERKSDRKLKNYTVLLCVQRKNLHDSRRNHLPFFYLFDLLLASKLCGDLR